MAGKRLISKSRPVEGVSKSRSIDRGSRARRCDPQQYALYRLEREEIGARAYARLYTLSRVRTVCRAVCRSYSVPAPRLKFVKMPEAAQWHKFETETHATIEISKIRGTATDLLTILHELAHHVHFYLGPDTVAKQQDHGPEFMACYMSILDTVRFIPRDAMAVICDRHGVKYKEPGPSTESLRKAIQ